MAKSTSKLFDDSNGNKLATALNDAVENDIMNPPVSEASKTQPEDVEDIELEVVKKKRFRFNKDNSKILELNTSDLNIVTRLTTAYNELNSLMDEVGKELSTLPDDDTEEGSMEQMEKVSEALKKLDSQMREKMDYIFDAPVSKVCASEGSMYDPIDGSFRYEHIIEKLTSLYENNLNKEFSKMKRRVADKTSKYTKKFHN